MKKIVLISLSLLLIQCNPDIKKHIETPVKNKLITFDYELLSKNKINYISLNSDTIRKYAFSTKKKINHIDENYKFILSNLLSDKNIFDTTDIIFGSISDKSKMVLIGAYQFSFSNKQYYTFFFDDWEISCNYCYYFILLFEVDENHQCTQIPIGSQQTESPSCISDFNSDGILDYVLYESSKCRFFH